MGIRPQFYIVVGIDDAKPDDPRLTPKDAEYLEEVLSFRDLTEDEMWTDGDLFNDWRQCEDKWPGYTRALYELLYNPLVDSEYCVENVVGLVIHEGSHDDNILRALAAIDDKYLEAGYVRIPILDPEKHYFRYRFGQYSDDDIRCNRFVHGVFESMPSMSRMQWKRAQHYLGLVGWNIPEEDLRYMLVWDWS